MSARSSQCAAVLTAPHRTALMHLPLTDPGKDEIRVRLQGCGICASNLPVWEGRPWFTYPLSAGSPGHEGWGVVDAVGDDVADLAPGDRVALMSHHAYAEYDVAPRAAAVRLPDALGDLPFPGEPLGCAMNIFERSDIRPGHTVAIVGAGFLGLLLTQLARAAGARVIAISRRSFALSRAREMGASDILAIEDGASTSAKVLRLTDGDGCDRVIEAAGLQTTLDLASAITREAGRLIIAGYHQDGPRQVDMQQWNWRGIDVINAHERSIARYVSGIERAIEAVLDGRMDPFPLFTHEVALDALADGFELTRTRPEGFMKALLTIEGRA